MKNCHYKTILSRSKSSEEETEETEETPMEELTTFHHHQHHNHHHELGLENLNASNIKLVNCVPIQDFNFICF